ncbi:MAG: exodeoxyribonuclease VII large subunit [Chloroflexi bacterium]|nr:exodeoxyribonuclease VII large subunit [Chloroflexota bacterium]
MQVVTVGQVARYLHETLADDAALTDLWVSGEVSNLARSSLGHTYFTLKDSTSQLRCLLFRGTGFEQELANGGAVIVHGRVSFYEPRGELRLLVDVVQPEGVGALALAFAQLKARLEAEGLFDEARKRPLPPFPQRIAVVTSPTGAVWHDICNVIRRRYPLVELLLVPTPVQGDSAVPGIVAAFQALDALEGIDVVILARGGGSLEELWAFNTVEVARAVYGSRAPVICGVGHETDVTIADLVADRRASTPSAAAELAVPDRTDLLLRVAAARQHLHGALRDLLARRQDEVGFQAHRLRILLPRLDREQQRVDDYSRLLTLHLRGRLAHLRAAVALRVSQLEALNPRQTLARGYALVHHTDTAHLITAPRQVRPGDPLTITVAEGSFTARAGGATDGPPRRRRSKGAPDNQMALFQDGGERTED